jgi:hypothetical protein
MEQLLLHLNVKYAETAADTSSLISGAIGVAL